MTAMTQARQPWLAASLKQIECDCARRGDIR
jgi:hypothetical protein